MVVFRGGGGGNLPHSKNLKKGGKSKEREKERGRDRKSGKWFKRKGDW